MTAAELSEEASAYTLDIDGTVAMHRHFAECARKGVAPSSDIRDVIKTSHLVDQLAGKGGSAGRIRTYDQSVNSRPLYH